MLVSLIIFDVEVECKLLAVRAVLEKYRIAFGAEIENALTWARRWLMNKQLFIVAKTITFKCIAYDLGLRLTYNFRLLAWEIVSVGNTAWEVK